MRPAANSPADGLFMGVTLSEAEHHSNEVEGEASCALVLPAEQDPERWDGLS